MAAKTEASDARMKDGKLLAFPVAAAETIYRGSTVLLDATNRDAFSNDGTTFEIAASDIFLGICAETMDNSAGAAAAKDVRVDRTGVHLLTFTDTLTAADLGKKVYLNNTNDDAAVSVTSAANPVIQVEIGVIVEVASASTAHVDITRHVDNLAAVIPS